MIYVGGRGNDDAEIMFVGEAIGPEEERLQECFIGNSGRELGLIAREIGINIQECWLTNVIRHKPPTNHMGKLDITAFITRVKKNSEGKTFFYGNYVSPVFLQHLADLRREIEIIKPKVIIALGDVAMFALTGKNGITSWRGSELWLSLPDCKHKCLIIPTFNPAFIYGNWPARRLIRRDLQRARECLPAEKPHEYSWHFILRPSFEVAMDYLETYIEHLAYGPVKLAVDIETRRGQIECIGLAHSKTEAICIPIFSVSDKSGYWSFEEECAIVNQLRLVLTHPNAEIIGHNFHYDDSYIAKSWGFSCHVKRDTMIRWHTAFLRLEKSLAFICSLLCEHYVYWKDDGKEWDSSMPEEQRWAYNCTDCVRTFEIDELIEAFLHGIGLEAPADIEQALYDPVTSMMFRGMKQDVVLKKALSKELGEEIKTRQDWMARVLGHELNTASNSRDGQMKTLFFEDLRQKKQYSRKTQELTLDDVALNKVYMREPLLRPLIRVIRQVRSLRVFKQTFTDALIDADDRIRTHFWIPGTNSTRFASKKNPFDTGANLQNIPMGNETELMEVVKAAGDIHIEELAERMSTTVDDVMLALYNPDPEHPGLADSGFIAVEGDQVRLLFSLPNIRKIFIPDEGYTLVMCDLKGADFQVMIWEADAQNLKDMLKAGLDVHSELAKITGLPRQKSKTLIHATDYSAKAPKIAESLGISVHSADKAQKAYLNFVPGVVDYQKRVVDSVTKQGYVENAFGFRCYFFDRPGDIVPEALAWIPQSTVAITINIGITNAYKHLPEVEPLLQVHDEADFQIRDELLAETMPKLHEQMLITIPYDDPLVIPLEFKTSKKSWGELEPWRG